MAFPETLKPASLYKDSALKTALVSRYRFNVKHKVKAEADLTRTMLAPNPSPWQLATASENELTTGSPCPERDFIRNGNFVALGQRFSRNCLAVHLTSDKIAFMAKTLIETVVKQLQQERARLEDELTRVTTALTSFGNVLMGSKRGLSPMRKKRTISAAGRKRIAAAQRARWAKVRASKK